ncbi:hypothetical protein Tco_1370289 [Tanacetum coccineum]
MNNWLREILYEVYLTNFLKRINLFVALGQMESSTEPFSTLNSKSFRVFNSSTRIVEENLHIRFSKSTPIVVGSGPDWLFDIDALTRLMNYEPIVAGTQSNGFAGTKASDNASQAIKETKPVKDYHLCSPFMGFRIHHFFQDPRVLMDDGSNL